MKRCEKRKANVKNVKRKRRKRVEEEAIIKKNINIVVYCTDCAWFKLCEIVGIINV